MNKACLVMIRLMYASAAGPATGIAVCSIVGSAVGIVCCVICAAMSACATWVIRTSCVLTTEMPIEPPMLRDRLSKAAPVVRIRGANVSNARLCSGTKIRPRPSPWTTPLMITGRDGCLEDRFPALEPIVLLAAVEAKLKRAQRDREQRKPEHVELALMRLRLRHESQHQQQADDTDGQIDQEHPAPIVIVGQPAAEHRPEDRADHHAAAEQRHRLAVLFAGVDVEQGCLGEWD